VTRDERGRPSEIKGPHDGENHESKGRITPQVIDARRQIRDLMRDDCRAGPLSSAYDEGHADAGAIVNAVIG